MLRVGWFERDFLRGALAATPPYAFGAFTGERFAFLGEDVARRQDTVAAAAPLPGFGVPDYSERTPWGVPAFFRGVAPRGEVAWNHYRELRGQIDVGVAASPGVDVQLGAEATRQRVETFQRVLAWLPVDSGVPTPVAADFAPFLGAGYAEVALRGGDFVVTGGVRYDRVLTRHHHLVCDRCNAMIDFVDEALDELPLPNTSPLGFQVRDYRVQVRGICAACREEER